MDLTPTLQTQFLQKNTLIFHPLVVLRTPRHEFSQSVSEEILKEFFTQKREMEALFLASPQLTDAFIAWQNENPISLKDKAKLLQSLAKYYLRAHNRPTPFGLFSGLCTLPWGLNTAVTMAPKINRHTRLDMNFLCDLAQKLSKIPVIRQRLSYTCNTSLYNLNNNFRYVEYFYQKGKRIHQLSAVSSEKYLSKTLQFAENRGVKYELLVNNILDKKVNTEIAEDFINQLINLQILVSELEPCVAGEEYMQQILRILQEINFDKNQEITNIIKTLNEVNTLLNSLDENIENEIDEYKNIIEKLQVFEVEIDENTIFQTDMGINPNEGASISKNHQNEIIEVIHFLQKLNLNQEETNINNFIEKFTERYQEQEIPLAHALDIENGIGYLNKNQSDFKPLIEDINFEKKENKQFELNENQQVLFEQLIEANRNQKLEIDLSTIEFNKNTTPQKDLAPSFNVLFRALKNERILIEAIGGSSAATLLGRFGHMDPAIEKLVMDITKEEEAINNDVLFAEIVHLPESRTGNVIMHPQYRSFEIPYLAQSNLSNKNQLTIDDLMLSINNNELIIRSKKTGKKVIPRLSNAHNYAGDSLPVYQFLCDMQCQNIHQFLNFEWGKLATGFKYLPRITYKKTILSPAQWKFTSNDLKPLKNIDLLIVFLKKQKVPSKFYVVEGDNELFINTKQTFFLEILFAIISKKHGVELKEYFEFSTEIRSKKGKNLTYAHQFVASLVNQQSIYLPIHNYEIIEKTRQFSIGSEWLYFKIYCGAKTSEDILTNEITDFLSEAKNKNWIKGWFFIRYNDPDPHLRLRFLLSDSSFLQKSVNLIHKKLSKYLENKTIWKIQADTYERELERYGFKTIEQNEQVFQASSHAVLGFLLATQGDEREVERLLFALKLTDVTLNIYGLNLSEKTEFIEILKSLFHEEFKIEKDQKITIDSKFREYKALIFNILNSDSYDFLEQIQQFKNEAIIPIGYILENTVDEKLQKALAGQIHMHINRIFNSFQREHELLIYDFLHKYYKAKVAMQKTTI